MDVAIGTRDSGLPHYRWGLVQYKTMEEADLVSRRGSHQIERGLP